MGTPEQPGATPTPDAPPADPPAPSSPAPDAPPADPPAPSSPAPDAPPADPPAPSSPAPESAPGPDSAPSVDPPGSAPASSPAGSPAPAGDTGGDVGAQLAQMRAQIEQLQAKAATGQLTTQPVDDELQETVKKQQDTYKDWPQPGNKFADHPQPYQLQEQGLPQPGVNRNQLPAGEPDTLSPVVVSHSQPTIAPGSAGRPVSFLAGLLAKLGYHTTISRGQNHAYTFDESVAHALETFKREWHVVEDSSAFRTVEEAARVAGPWVWEALLRATRAAPAAAAVA